MRHRDAARAMACKIGLAMVAGASFYVSSSIADDWPQWRGPNRDGHSAETGLLQSWPEEGPQVLWRRQLGDGYSGIAVVQGRVFTMFGSGGDEYAAAFDAAGGEELWRFRMGGNLRSSQGGGPRATPTVSGQTAYFLGARSKLYALDIATGEKRWGSDLESELGSKVPEWGTSTSPVIEGDALIVDVAGRKDYGIVAFDKDTGEILWHSGSHLPAYSSPIVVTLGGVRQVVAFHARGLVGVSAEDGERLWSVPWTTDWDVNAATPIFVPNSGIFVSTDYDVGAALFQIVREGEEFKPYRIWKNREMKNHFNSSVLVDAHIYGFDMGTLKCVDALTGEQVWRARGDFSKGSLLWADGKLIVLGGSGNLGLIEATPEEFRRLGYARILESKTWTPPALANGVLFVRDFAEMLALRVGAVTPASNLSE